MTPYEAYQIEQERIEQQDAITQEQRIEGMTDAAFGYLPQYADDSYLNGYLEGIKQLPRDHTGKILHYSPLQPEVKDEQQVQVL